MSAQLALGTALILGIMRHVNIAQGELVMVAGDSLLLLNHASPLLVVPKAVAVAVGVALVTERGWLSTRSRSESATLLATSFALSSLCGAWPCSCSVRAPLPRHGSKAGF
jgi:branched-subunit amino acid ABC-type transport system permease component